MTGEHDGEPLKGGVFVVCEVREDRFGLQSLSLQSLGLGLRLGLSDGEVGDLLGGEVDGRLGAAGAVDNDSGRHQGIPQSEATVFVLRLPVEPKSRMLVIAFAVFRQLPLAIAVLGSLVSEV